MTSIIDYKRIVSDNLDVLKTLDTDFDDIRMRQDSALANIQPVSYGKNPNEERVRQIYKGERKNLIRQAANQIQMGIEPLYLEAVNSNQNDKIIAASREVDQLQKIYFVAKVDRNATLERLLELYTQILQEL